MADRTGLAIGRGVAQGLEKASGNLLNVMLAKDKLDMKKEELDTQKKISDLKIKKLKNEVDPDTLEMARETQKAKLGLKEKQLELAEKKIQGEEAEAKIAQRLMSFLEGRAGRQGQGGGGLPGDISVSAGGAEYTQPGGLRRRGMNLKEKKYGLEKQESLESAAMKLLRERGMSDLDYSYQDAIRDVKKARGGSEQEAIDVGGGAGKSDTLEKARQRAIQTLKQTNAKRQQAGKPPYIVDEKNIRKVMNKLSRGKVK